MRIPLACPEVTDADVTTVVEVLRSSRLSDGPVMRAFEEALASYLGVAHAVALSSGTTALQLALRALQIGEGDEVILPSFSFMGVSNAVLNEKAAPVFVDIEETSFNIDPSALDAVVSARSKAIIVVHTFGYPARIEKIIDFADQHGLYVIEDACEALGTEVHGHKAGAFGDVGILAFYPNKQITTGEGGALVTNSTVIAEKVRRLRNQGRRISGDWFQNIDTGGSYRLSDINCALGLQQLSRIEDILQKRDALAERYEKQLATNNAVTCLNSHLPDSRVSWFTYPILLPIGFTQSDRDEVWLRMGELGIECGRYFPPAHLQPVMQGFSFQCGNLSRTLSLAERMLCLPFFNKLKDAQIESVCTALEEVLAEHQLKDAGQVAGSSR